MVRITAVRQRAINIIQLMPETEVLQFVIKNERYEKPEVNEHKKVTRQDGWEAFHEMRRQVQDAGLPEMTLDDINAEIAEVRAERKAKKAVSK